MSERQRFIHPIHTPDPVLVAMALRRVATVLDRADDGNESVYSSTLGPLASVAPDCHAWAAAAIIIADEHDIDSVKLRTIANTIDKGEQYALPF